MNADRLTIADIERDRATASSMRAACPVCDRPDRKVLAQHHQATRKRPCQFLCFQGWCVDCQTAFDLDAVQLTLVTS